MGEYHGPRQVRAFRMYLQARAKRLIIDKSYREYVTDSLRAIPSMSYLEDRWRWDSVLSVPKPELSAEEIADAVIAGIEG